MTHQIPTSANDPKKTVRADYLTAITPAAAVHYWANGTPVFILHDDDTEGLVESAEELDHAIVNNWALGIEKPVATKRENALPLRLGFISPTTEVSSALDASLLHELLRRHRHGDWGDLCEDDRLSNETALTEGRRIFSAYKTPAGKVWIITEADASATTILFPHEY